MNYLRLSEREISNHIGDARIYHRGRMYFFNGFVKDVYIKETGELITAKVRGTQDYLVKFFLNPHRDIYAESCTCPFYKEFEKPCKHIAAVLFELKQSVKDEYTRYKNSHNAVTAIFEKMESENTASVEGNIEQINLYPILYISKPNAEVQAWLELKTGIMRPYVVKSALEFLDAWLNRKKLRFGNQLILDSSRQYYTGSDKLVMDLLKEIYITNMELQKLESLYSYSGFLKGRQILLAPSKLEKFLDIMLGESITASINKDNLSIVPVVEECVPATFEIRQMDEWLSVKMNQDNMPVELIPNGRYYYLQGKIYKVSNSQRKYLSIIQEGFKKAGTNEVIVPSQYQNRFISEVVPLMKKSGDVMVSPSLKDKIVQETFKAEVYLDQYKRGVCAKVLFIYGAYKINPAVNDNFMTSNNGYILRSIEKEQKILNFLQETGFYIEDNQFYLMNKEAIYRFAFEKLPELQDIADVYYSGDFKKITVKRSVQISGRISLVDNLLEVSFDTENLDSDELKGILQSLRRKKKFYRLKDGGILPLEQYPDLNEFLHIANQMDISPKDLDDGKFHMPKYRAFYLENFFSETKTNIIEKTQDFEQYVKELAEIKNEIYEIPESLKNVLRDYQKIGFQWLKVLSKSGLGGVLADDMGLGKTLQVLALIMSEKEEKKYPALVIAPTSLVYNWVLEAEKFTPELKVMAIAGNQIQRQPLIEKIDEYDLIVTSYPLIRRDVEEYRKHRFSFCFIDEAQHVKNRFTQSAKAVRKIPAQNRFALTGTPMENSLMELWSIFDFIMPSYLFTQKKFQDRFVKPIVNEGNKEVSEDLSRHIRPFILRRMKRDVLKELPDKIETTLTCEMTKAQKDIYHAILSEVRKEIELSIEQQGFEKNQIQILAALTRLRQICCHPSSFLEDYEGGSGKLELLNEILEDNLSAGHRVLLFSQFTSMLDIIESELIKNGTNYFYLSGKTPVSERSSIVSRFNEGEGKVFLLSLKAGGTGLTLTGADTVIHYDPWWNPAVEEQATDRAYRIGQEKVVQVFKLITRNTIEEKILLLQKRKKEMIDMVIKPGETMIHKLTKEEIRQLFEE